MKRSAVLVMFGSLRGRMGARMERVKIINRRIPPKAASLFLATILRKLIIEFWGPVPAVIHRQQY